ncbi:hypothetical protein GGS24DRAFT_511227 [Hypoxylon argillaceum]|nr:hypothetical protein GGS24DRAFT_511227 [Hypoxylon argillaceum]
MSQRGRPDDDPKQEKYIPVLEAHPLRNSRDGMIGQLPRTDRDMYEREEYLRRRWVVTDPMPDSFDPDKLEAVRKSLLPRKTAGETSDKGQEQDTIPVVRQTEVEAPLPAHAELQTTPREATSSVISDESGYNASDTSQSESGYLDTDEESEGGESEYESEDSSKSKGKSPQRSTSFRSRSSSIPPTHRGRPPRPERVPTPRIGTGSKPPLSRSAFARHTGPCADEKCPCRSRSKRRLKAPQYFPRKGQRRPSRSRDRSGQRSAGADGDPNPRWI